MNEFLNDPTIDWAALRCIAFVCALFAVGYAIAYAAGRFK